MAKLISLIKSKVKKPNPILQTISPVIRFCKNILILSIASFTLVPKVLSAPLLEQIIRLESLEQINCPPPPPNTKTYDVIVFGDEVPGVMTAIQVQRELKKRAQSARVAIVTEGDTNLGIGGHLVRGGLAYLDRNQIPRDMRARLGRFYASSPLYQEFLNITGTDTIALDRFKAATGFKQILSKDKIDVFGNVNLRSVVTTPISLCSFITETNSSFSAKQFIDASQGGELAQKAGVKMFSGFGALGLPDSSLGIGLGFEIYGLSIDQLAEIEERLIRRLLNPQDLEAQNWIKVASGDDPKLKKRILASLVSGDGTLRTMYQGTDDSADVRSLAFTVAFHGGNNQSKQNYKEILDQPNIAVLKNRLSFNAMLFYVDAETSSKLSDNGSKPLPYMLAFAKKVEKFFLRLGASKVEIMNEAYIRSTAQIANPLEELSATLMTKGGVPSTEALGTFSYHLDVRGGIKGLRVRATKEGVKTLDLRSMPTFNYGFRHTLPLERQNLAVLGPTSGFGGLGTAAGRIVEFNVSVGEGLAIALAKAITEKRPLHSIKNQEVRQALGYIPVIYGRSTGSFQSVSVLEKVLKFLP
jgi:hypothetical protein